MDETSKSSSNVFSEKNTVEKTLIDVRKDHYTKQEVMILLDPIYRVLEQLTTSMDIVDENTEEVIFRQFRL